MKSSKEKTDELERFYKENFENLLKIAYRKCRNTHDAEDIVQTAFLRALRFMPDNVYSMHSWFKAVLQNVFMTYLEERRNKGTVNISDEEMESIAQEQEEYSDDILSEIHKVIEEKEGEEREVLRLYYMNGLTIGGVHHALDSLLTYKEIRGVLKKFKKELQEKFSSE